MVSQARRSSSSRTVGRQVAVEGDASPQAQLRDQRLQADPLRPVADDVDPQPGTGASPYASWCSSRSIRLCGTSRATTVIVGSGSRGPRRLGAAAVPLGTMWIGPRKPQPVPQLLAGRGRHRRDRRGPVHRRVAVPLQEPAHGGEHRANRMCELVLVHVVHHLHDRHVAPTNSGEKNGMPFWQSTTYVDPARPRTRASAVRG